MKSYYAILMESISGSGHKFWFDSRAKTFNRFEDDHSDYLEDNCEAMGIDPSQVTKGGEYERNYLLAFSNGFVRGGFEFGEKVMYFSGSDARSLRKAVAQAYTEFPQVTRMRIDIVDQDCENLQWVQLKGEEDIAHFAKTGMAPRRLMHESKARLR